MGFFLFLIQELGYKACGEGMELFSYEPVITSETRKVEEVKEIEEKKEEMEEYVSSPPKKYNPNFVLEDNLNYLNIFNIGVYDDVSDCSIQKFGSVFMENYLDLRPIDKNKNSCFPMAGYPYGDFSREKVFEDYCRSDKPNMYVYDCKTTGQMLGSMLLTHPVNIPGNERMINDKDKIFDLKEKPLMWAPGPIKRLQTNQIIQKSDYTRFVYYCDHYEDDADRISNPKIEEMINGNRFWYKDSSNYPSSIRSLVLSDVIEKLSGEARKLRPFQPSPTTGGLPPDSERGDMIPTGFKKKILSKLKNKIIVVEHRRINVTDTWGEIGCPIIKHYIKNGWKLSSQAEDDECKEIDPITAIAETITSYSGYHNPNTDFHGGCMLLTGHTTSSYVGEKLIHHKRCRSILITKTTFIDVDESGLFHSEGMYFREVDLVIGKIKVNTPDGVRYPVEYINHPNSKDGYSSTFSTMETLELLYVDHENPSTPPLYFNTHGMITKVLPCRNKNYKTGVYIVKRRGNSIVGIIEVKKEELLEYGIFGNLEDAQAYSQITSEFLSDVGKVRSHKLHNAKYAADMEMISFKRDCSVELMKNSSALKQQEFNFKTQEFNLKFQELEAKGKMLEFELMKLECRKIPETLSATLKPLSESITSVVKLVDTISKIKGG